jgi:Domain of Unknown Function (DUF1080)
MRRLSATVLSLSAMLLLSALLPAGGAEERDEVIKLFNGKDLTNFYTYLAAPTKGEKPYGKNHDPEHVFTVHDGMIDVSGKVWGGLITEREYENYHLTVEFKWGEKTWPPREHNARDSGVLLHCTGPDGGVGQMWMESFECQMIEGGTGDFIIVGGNGKRSLTVEAEKRPTGEGEKRHEQLYYKPGAPGVTLKGGRFNWYGRDPLWKDVKGFRGAQDAERPVGEWNTLECVCDGDRITNRLNGKAVNAGTQASHTKGKILFQSEGAEVFFRRIELKPLRR